MTLYSSNHNFKLVYKVLIFTLFQPHVHTNFTEAWVSPPADLPIGLANGCLYGFIDLLMFLAPLQHTTKI